MNFDNEREPTYEKGKLVIKEDNVTTLIYEGEFDNNNFRGNGKL